MSAVHLAADLRFSCGFAVELVAVLCPPCSGGRENRRGKPHRTGHGPLAHLPAKARDRAEVYGSRVLERAISLEGTSGLHACAVQPGALDLTGALDGLGHQVARRRVPSRGSVASGSIGIVLLAPDPRGFVVATRGATTATGRRPVRGRRAMVQCNRFSGAFPASGHSKPGFRDFIDFRFLGELTCQS